MGRSRISGCNRLEQNAKRQVSRSAYLTGSPRHRVAVDQFELREPLDELLNGDAQLQPREVRADATVDTQPEGGVSIGGAIDNEFVGVFEGGRVAIGGRKTQEDP